MHARVVRVPEVRGSIEGVDEISGDKDTTSTGVCMEFQFLE